jgi:pyruvate,orthophosphate dikinase
LQAVREADEEPDTAPARHLERTIGAVFRSWDNPRAKAYRKHHAIPDDLGTAVTVQAMVFGNLDENSGSGAAFPRNQNTGEPTLYGEYLTGRQGEDIVSGTHTPVALADPQALPAGLRDSLFACGRQLEAIYRDAVDIEFTMEASRLYLLQVRPAKRTAHAAVGIAVEGVEEGLMACDDVLNRVSAEQLRKLLRPVFDEAELRKARELAQGLDSSPGHAHGAAVLDSDSARALASQGEQVILVRPTRSPQDIRGMLAAAGIVTAKGGALNDAAVVSRVLDKPCIVGCERRTNAKLRSARSCSTPVPRRWLTAEDCRSISGFRVWARTTSGALSLIGWICRHICFYRSGCRPTMPLSCEALRPRHAKRIIRGLRH